MTMQIPQSQLFQFRRAAPPPAHLDTSQQYVVGREVKGELYLLYQAYPPAVGPISNPDLRFQVFVQTEPSDMVSLVGIWHHSSRLHETMLKVYSLKELGIT